MSHRVSVKSLYAWAPKLNETITDVREGRLSHNTGTPLTVSQLDKPRGKFFILDGHHRIVEAIVRGESTIAVNVDQYVPHIQRTGGSHSSYVDEMINVYNKVWPLR
jgi:hypothetical protein